MALAPVPNPTKTIGYGLPGTEDSGSVASSPCGDVPLSAVSATAGSAACRSGEGVECVALASGGEW